MTDIQFPNMFDFAIKMLTAAATTASGCATGESAAKAIRRQIAAINAGRDDQQVPEDRKPATILRLVHTE